MLFSQHGDLRQMSRKINKTKNKSFGKRKRSAAGAAIQQIVVASTPSITNDITTTDSSLTGSNSPVQYIIDNYKDGKKLIIRGADLFEVSYSNGVSITKLGSFPDGLTPSNEKNQDVVAYDPISNRLARLRYKSFFNNSALWVGADVDIFNLDNGTVSLYGSYNEETPWSIGEGYNRYYIVYASNAEGFVLLRSRRTGSTTWQRLMWGAAFIDPTAATLTATYSSFMTTSYFYNGISRVYYSENYEKIYVLGYYQENTTIANEQKSEIASFQVNNDGTFTNSSGGTHYYAELTSLAGIKVSQFQSSFFEYNGQLGLVYMDKEFLEGSSTPLYTLKMILFDTPGSEYSIHSNIIIDDDQDIRSPMGWTGVQLDSWATTVSIVSNNYLFVAYPLLAVNSMDYSATQSKIKIAKINLTDNSVEIREVGEGLSNYYGNDSTPFVFTNLGDNTDKFLLSIIPNNYADPFASFENHLISPVTADPWEEVSTASGLDLLTQKPEVVSGFGSTLAAGAAYYLGSNGQPTTDDTESGFLGIAVDDSTIKMTSKKFSQLKVDKLVLGTVEFEPNENKELVMKNQSGELMVLKPNGDVIFKGS